MNGPGIRWRRWHRSRLAVAATAGVHSFMNTATRIDQGRLFVPEPEHARLSSLGFDAVVADYYWLQALQLVGGDARRHPAARSRRSAS